MKVSRVGMCLLTLFLCLTVVVSASAQGPNQEQAQSSAPAASATIPRLIRVQGAVRDDAGQPLTGRAGITFTLYSDQDSQDAIWQEYQIVQFDTAGRYSVLLGATNDAGLPQQIFSAGEARWLGVRPDGQSEQPRILLLSVAYALKAADSEMLGGRPASAYALAETQASASPSYANSPIAAAIPTVSATAGPLLLQPQTTQPQTANPQTACAAVTSDGTATNNQLAKFTAACNLENSAIFESGGNVGIGTTAPAGTLDVFGTAFIRGALTLPPTNTASTTAGFTSQPQNLEASVYNAPLQRAITYIFQWQAEPSGNDTTNTGATLNLLYGVPGITSETGLSIARNGIISFAPGQTFPGGSGTVTSVATGAGLTGGPITTTGTISIPSAGVTNAMLANSSITVKAGTGLSGGGTVALGGTVTLSSASTGGTVTSVGTGTGLTGGPITGSGTLSLDTAYTDARYLLQSGGTLAGALTGTTAAFTGGLSATSGTFTGALTAGGALLPITGAATASKGFNSNPFDFQASSFSSSTSKAVTQDFRWQAEPAANDSSNPSASLNLLFGSNGAAPAETGLSIASNGRITFAPGQTFPGGGSGGGGGTVTSVNTGAGLTGGPITGTGTISIPAAGVTNAMLANPSITVAAGSGLSGGGTVALGGTVTLSSNLAGTANGIPYFSTPSALASTAAPANGQILVGSTGKAPVLTNLTAGANVSITNGPGSITISATGGSGGGAPTLPLFVTANAVASTTLTLGSNVTRLWGFILPYNLTTTQVIYNVTTKDDTANDYNIGIFDSNGNRVVDLGATPGTTFSPSTGFKSLKWKQGATSLVPGKYYLAMTTNCSTSCMAISAGSFVSFASNTSAGVSYGGSLPTAITPPADAWIAGKQPVVVIE